MFGARTRDALLLIFFTSIGLSAKFSALLKGGKPLLILCVVTVLALHCTERERDDFRPPLGHTSRPDRVLAGSLSFVGGPGTAMAWAKELEATGLKGAQVVGVGAATLAVVVGALVSGPVAGWIVRAHKLRAETAQEAVATFADAPPPEPTAEAPSSHIERILATVFVIALSVFLGEKINMFAKDADSCCPASSRP